MSRSKYTSAVSIVVTAAMLIATVLFMSGESLGLTAASSVPKYAQTLFSADAVHQLDIIVDEAEWQGMLGSAQAKEYIMCDVVIDGESVKNVAIRPKGNSSLSSIATSDTDRYSFKIEFDHYNGAQTYHGLDKLALNNITQDNTYLKDYVSYQMMNAFGADAPLSSFIYIKVNGEDWGLYLAVEGIEEAFAERSYGSDYGQIYKPDSMDMAAGRNGGDDRQGGRQLPDGFDGMYGFPQDRQFPQDGQGRQRPGSGQEGEASGETQDGQPTFPQEGQIPDGGQGLTQDVPDFPGGQIGSSDDRFGNGFAGMGGFGGMGSGSRDVALQYIDDDADSYPNIFDNAMFDASDADKKRLISAIKAMNEGDMESSVNVEEVLRYFVVHNFVLNFDSYTGGMLHNYYLYEDEGKLSMIAWDYNLAFGAFSMGNNMSGQESGGAALINYPIDTPTSGTSMENIPLLNNLLTNGDYMAQYHELFSQFISEYFDSGEFERMYDSAVSLISPYVEKDPTAFCTYDEFLQAQEMLKRFCLLRAESVKGQLDGTIASTSEGQSSTQNSGFIDASEIDVSVMGSNMSGFGRGRDREEGWRTDKSAFNSAEPGAEQESGAAYGDAIPNAWSDGAFSRFVPDGQESTQNTNGTDAGGQSTGGEDTVRTAALLAASAALAVLGLAAVKFYRV